ncbi:MAG: DUF6531 domain-containing protein, partial [Myxococcales bacterium]|nr:DUF6531 domain-containing protein [Myxococcales bacterium]
MNRLVVAIASILILFVDFIFISNAAHAQPAMCSPMDQSVSSQDSWDNSACCDGIVSDDGCGPKYCEDDSGYSSRIVGLPVDIMTGFMWTHGTDVSIAAPAGPTIEFQRTYSSAWAQSQGGRHPGVLGAGWSHTYAARLELSGNTPALQVTYRRADTGSEDYTLSNGIYVSRHPGKALRFDAESQLYFLERRDSSIEVFDVQGRLKVLRDADGGEVQLQYVGEDSCAPLANRPAGELCRVDFVFGQQLWFWYASSAAGNRLDRISWDSEGVSIVASYSYDTEGYLTSAAGIDGAVMTYEYNFTHHFRRGPDGRVKLLTRILDAEGYSLETFTYRQRGDPSRVTKHTTQDEYFEVESAPENRNAAVSGTSPDTHMTWQNGKVRTACRVGADGSIQWDRCQEFDAPDNLAGPQCERSADGFLTRIERDSLGRTMSNIQGVSSCQNPSASDLSRATRFGYVVNSNRLAFEQRPSLDPNPPEGFRAATIYDYTSPIAQTNPFCGQDSCQKPESYNKASALASQLQQIVRVGRTLSVDGTWFSRVTAVRNEYGPFGQRIRVAGPRRDVDDSISYDYYDIGAPGPEAGRLKAVRRGESVLARFSDYLQNGKARQITDEAGNTILLDYDAAGRVLSTQLPGDTGKTIYQYRANGQLWKVTFPSGRWISSELDELGRVESIEWHGEDGTLVEKLVYKHVSDDPARPDGRFAAIEYYVNATMIRQTTFSYSDSKNFSVEESNGAWNLQFFDEERRLAGMLDGNHRESGQDFWERRTLEHVYDAMGELARVKRLISGQWVDQNRFSRDLQGNIAIIKDTAGNESRYIYDDFGNLVEHSSLTTGTRRFEYDEAGNLVKERTPEGIDIVRTYDARNRLLTVKSTGLDERYTYDVDTAVAIVDCATDLPLGLSLGAGRVTQIQDASGTTYFGYTTKGARSFEAQLAPGATCARTLRWSYNENGEVTSTRYPTGHEIIIDYAGRHWPSNISAKIGNKTIVLASNISIQGGRLAGYTAGNGMKWIQSRQLDGWPDELKIELANGEIVRRQKTGGHHDGAGNLTQVEEESDSLGVQYNYEPDRNVLSRVKGPLGIQEYVV